MLYLFDKNEMDIPNAWESMKTMPITSQMLANKHLFELIDLQSDF